MGFKNTVLPVAATISAHGRLLDLSHPVVMGILNVTPDSFYTGTTSRDEAIRLAGVMLDEGAAILDIGGASSKPGAEDVPVEEELRRVIDVVPALARMFPEAWISIDTMHAAVAKVAVEAGAHIVNDISAGHDAAMISTVAGLRVPYIAMHMQGTPKTMQNAPAYGDVVQEVFDFLKGIVLRCADAGIHDLVLDLGFGFGKTVEHNFALLNELAVFRALGKPLLAGISRKRMICEPLRQSPKDALNGTTALHMAALREGASILRVHDVREAVETIKLFSLIAA